MLQQNLLASHRIRPKVFMKVRPEPEPGPSPARTRPEKLSPIYNSGQAKHQTRAVVTPSQMHYPLHHIRLSLESCCINFYLLVFIPTGPPQEVDSMAPPLVNNSKRKIKKLIKCLF